MFRAPLRRLQPGLAAKTLTRRSAAAARRGLTTESAPKPKKGTWKGTALRWGAAVGAVYWYNTSPLFADDPLPQTGAAPPSLDDHDLVTVDKVIAEKRKLIEARADERAAREQAEKPGELESTVHPPEEKPTEAAPASTPAATEEVKTEVNKGGEAGEGAALMPGSPEALEEEAGQQGAFNPETGEINWDCPCLGGMADGPCGEEFKAAFSCFVYSKEEPKGMDCIDKFQGMQDCFRQHPEIYGAELTDDEDPDAPASTPADAQSPSSDAAGTEPASPTKTKPKAKTDDIPAASEGQRSPASQDAPPPVTAVPSADDAAGKLETKEEVRPAEPKASESKN